ASAANDVGNRSNTHRNTRRQFALRPGHGQKPSNPHDRIGLRRKRVNKIKHALTKLVEDWLTERLIDAAFGPPPAGPDIG
ncbi:hypothetical protein, partial [Mesorhizobium sp.]